jgi:hypothetical protein
MILLSYADSSVRRLYVVPARTALDAILPASPALTGVGPCRLRSRQ